MKMPKQKLYEPKGALKIERSFSTCIIKEENSWAAKFCYPRVFYFVLNDELTSII